MLRLWIASGLAAVVGCGDDTVPSAGDTDSDLTGTGGRSTGLVDDGSIGSGATDSGSTEGIGSPTSDSGTSGSEDTSTVAESSGGATSGDMFECDPIDLGSGLGAVYVGTTEGASNDLLVGCLKYDGPELALSWTAPAPGSYQIDTLDAGFDTAIQILLGDCDGEVAACNDDFFGLQSALLIDLEAGQTIVVVVDGYGGAVGDFTLSIVEAQPGNCCDPGFFGGCADNACETLVCAFDPACCSDQWDATCADIWAPILCADCAPPESCCFAQTDPGCVDPACEGEVCAIDASCCDVQWTTTCADLARDACSACMPQDCCTEHPGPGCGTPSCETMVCTQWSSWCCDVEWDSWCAQIANDYCPSCQDPGPCCAANSGIGCDTPAVEACVCDALPGCCGGQWTVACVAAVTDLGCGTCDPLDTRCVDTDLGSTLGEVARGNNSAAGNDTTITCTAAGGQEIVFSWVAPASDSFVFDTTGSNYDTALGIRFPDCAGAELACTGFLNDFNSEVALDLVEGQPVIIVLDGFGAATGDYVLNINPRGGPKKPPWR